MSRIEHVLAVGECLRELETKRNVRDALLQAYERAAAREVNQREALANFTAVQNFMRFSDFVYERDMPTCLDDEWYDRFNELELFQNYASRFEPEVENRNHYVLLRAFKRMSEYFKNVNGGNLRDAKSEHFQNVAR